MPKLLIIADDLTGALDTGVKFSEAGLKTTVSTRWQDETADEGADVAVLCADTRHLPSDQAYRVIRSIAEKNRERFPLLMKKTDSGLRGNIGAELQAVMDGAGEKHLAFLPALPEMRRVTRGGVQYIDGVPVSRSVFGRDPFEPVLDDEIPRLLGRQCSLPTRVISRTETREPDAEEGASIRIYDAETSDDMRRAIGQVLGSGQVRVLAGCAGLAQALAGELSDGTSLTETAPADEPLLVVCGSVNGISARQLDYAEAAGFVRRHLPMSYLLGNENSQAVLDSLVRDCAGDAPVMVDTFSQAPDAGTTPSPAELEDRRRMISTRLGTLVKELMDRGVRRRILIIGGDTLLALMAALGCSSLTPVREPARGVVLSVLDYAGERYRILSKSGGFGSEDLLTRL